MLEEKDIIQIIKSLSKKRKVFSSEADFQLALAMMIQRKYNKAEVHCEYPLMIDNKNMHIDIMVILNEKWYPIELKYKTKKLNSDKKESIIVDGGVEYLIKNQLAVDNTCYDYIKDITRIESIRNDNRWKHKFGRGFTIFVTNENRYFDGPSRENVNHKEFCLWESEAPLERSTNWLEKTSEKTKTARPGPLELDDDYYFKWEKYSEIKQDNSLTEFKYLLNEVKNINKWKGREI